MNRSVPQLLAMRVQTPCIPSSARQVVKLDKSVRQINQVPSSRPKQGTNSIQVDTMQESSRLGVYGDVVSSVKSSWGKMSKLPQRPTCQSHDRLGQVLLDFAKIEVDKISPVRAIYSHLSNCYPVSCVATTWYVNHTAHTCPWNKLPSKFGNTLASLTDT